MDLPEKKRDRGAVLLFVFGAFSIYVFGLIARFSALDDKPAVIAFSLAMDTAFVLVLGINQYLIRHGATSGFDIRAVAVTFGLALVSTVAMLALVLVSERQAAFGMGRLNLNIAHRFIYYFFIFSTFNFAGLWLHIQFLANQAALRALKAEREAEHAEVRRLRQQLDPHFIFSGLNLLAVDINDRPKRALSRLREMTNYLRLSMDTADIPFAPVAAEISAIRSFLGIHALRDDRRLVHRIEADPEARDRLLPTFLVIPLVEAAVVCGIPNADGEVAIEVTFAVAGDDLTIGIRSSGDLRFHDSRGQRTPLPPLEPRLALHYPGRHDLSRRQEGGDVLTVLRLEGMPR
ncbi:sensor histidine kinase [Zavarzinia compransoris]|uniref:Signal transduction histidine kinase internal region domain-containing protein n=1 Tax=Zavarzinia compransoris TaxID=1264899 RepID=A0A317DTS1_9PROT|nr:histidine kinase [Zavarzinia compransoris]PWR18087.1 hypothetical protein DKG75_21395 [Zavarzinia compransoris]TDP43437.1 histidine kinase [Zavarzinia compransoris]